MESSAGFGTTQLVLTDARLVFGLLNHLRYQALNHTFGVSRAQANVLTAVMLLGAADAAYDAARRVTGMRPDVGGADAALGAMALREVALGAVGPNVRKVPGLGALVVFALFGAVAAPRLRRAGQRMRAAEQALRAAEQRMRRERIRRYAAARERGRAPGA
jgi:hypothetical protein